MARTKGAKGIGEAERRLIRLAMNDGFTIPQIAETLGRSRVTIWKQVQRMQERGEMAQNMLPLSAGGPEHVEN